MNREIKFRGQCAISKEMVYGDLIHGVEYKKGQMYILPDATNLAYVKHCDPLDGVRVIPETVGEYSGLKDKHGKEIYENDLASDGKTIFKVEWNQNQSCFWLSPVKSLVQEDWVSLHLDNQKLGNGYLSRKDLEVIGNVFEHHHLLNP